MENSIKYEEKAEYSEGVKLYRRKKIWSGCDFCTNGGDMHLWDISNIFKNKYGPREELIIIKYNLDC